MAYKDPEAQRAAERRWYQKHREDVFARKNRKKAELRSIARRAKQRPCADCGVQYPYYVMDFDHVDDEKLMIISTLVNRGGRNRLLAELAKCDVVCSNCHRERTWQRLQRVTSPPARPSTATWASPTLFD
jgi:hypothetical protein